MARKEERYELNVFKLSKVTCKIEKEEKLEKGEIEGTGREVFGVGRLDVCSICNVQG